MDKAEESEIELNKDIANGKLGRDDLKLKLLDAKATMEKYLRDYEILASRT